jgi:hypothetical protein
MIRRSTGEKLNLICSINPTQERSHMKDNSYKANFLFGLLNGSINSLRTAPLEYNFLFSCILAFMWCLAFGIYTAELVFIGYSIIGHILLLASVFITWNLFRRMKNKPTQYTKNVVAWDLEKEGWLTAEIRDNAFYRRTLEFILNKRYFWNNI